MGIVFAVISGKGGVGKTTTSANLAIGTAIEGKKTVVVDFDIGQRNLDMILGLENRVVYDITNVMDGDASLKQALIKDKKQDNLYFLAASQTKDKSALDKERVKKLIDQLKEEFDYIFLDSPAGIEGGFEHTILYADNVIVVVNPEVSSIRDADRVIGLVDAKSHKAKEGEKVGKFLVITRIDPELIEKGEMISTEDILDILSINLLGKVPEDKRVIDASNTGKPVILHESSKAGEAYSRIAKRLCGIDVPFVDVEIAEEKGFIKKLTGLFK
ncbi:septum site-determining protein MinD [Hydrogenimonas thermophila]|uniref:Septum site-determining protein MinD n=1 Tax=Hydrogenimonas thermophila TaxID=223786 RepID=A0A1I5S1P1_9BACT|nr:septum site-determining protein MinD [Hydrogenimonas thermophila]WOE70182.1 septum site-determining protein MinD [Hydrogenimonas thermophila]WOE72699.1 septum site-determining protein MinD [Hydrogenimonas thermophila]SFP64471.1 septum site-determining protein MinD [Hydrogenimonas thermophila]